MKTEDMMTEEQATLHLKSALSFAELAVLYLFEAIDKPPRTASLKNALERLEMAMTEVNEVLDHVRTE